MDKQQQNEIIKEQFTKQASAYTAVKAHSSALDTLVELSKVSNKDNVLDIALLPNVVILS